SWKGTSFSRASKWNFHRQLYQPHKKPAFRGMDFSDCLGTRSSWKGTASAVPQIILSQTALQAPEKASFSRDGLQRLLGNAVLVEGVGFIGAANNTAADGF